MSTHRRCLLCAAALTSDEDQQLCSTCAGLEQRDATTASSSFDDRVTQLNTSDQSGSENALTQEFSSSSAAIPRKNFSFDAKLTSFGDYVLLQEIARGGMGIVFKARQLSLNRVVAVKMILTGQLASESDVERFRAEAMAAANLQHPNIVAVHEVGQHAGRHFFSMDYVEGKNLGELSRERPLSIKKAVEYVRKIALAIEYAHSQGTLHRDLKPSNVLVDQFDQPRVTDFGLAKRFDQDHEHTATGSIVGTPSYMPPEQAGANWAKIGPASDVYSLGAILYELLTGRPPFVGDTMLSTLNQVLTREPVSPRLLQPKLRRDIETICLKCLDKEPRRRYATAAALAADLECFLNDEPIQARAISAPGRAWRWCRRKPVVAGLIATAATLAAMVVLSTVNGYIKTHQALSRETTQRAIAERNERDAVQARQAAEDARSDVERSLYVAKMRLALAAVQAHEIERAYSLIEECDHNTERPDLRGWEWFFLRSLCGRELLKTHSLAANTRADAITWVGERMHLAVAQQDGTIGIWDEPGGTELGRLGEGKVSVIAYDPSRDRIAAGSKDGTITIWNAADFKLVRQFRAQTGAIGAIAFEPNGNRIASGSISGTLVKLHDTTTGSELKFLPLAQDVTAISWSPDGRFIAAGSYTRHLKVWDTASGNEVFDLKDYDQPIFSVAWKPDGTQLAVGGWNGIKVVDWKARRQIEYLNRRQYGERVVCWSPDGKRLAVAGDDWSIHIYDAANGHDIATIRSHKGGVTGLAWSSDSKALASASFDKTVVIHAIATETYERDLVDPGKFNWCLAWNPKGDRIAAGGEDKRCRIWNASTGQVETTFADFESLVRNVAWSNDGQRLAVASYDPMVRVYDVKSGAQLTAIDNVLENVSSIAFSPDDKRLALADWSGEVIVCDSADGRTLRHIHAHNTRADCVAWSPDGRYLASGGLDNKICIWHAESGRRAGTLEGHSAAVAHLGWSRDGTMLASASLDGLVKLWDVANRREIATLRGHSAGVFQIAWHPDQRRLASASLDQTWKVWDVRTGQDTLTIRPEIGSLNAIGWSADGRQIAVTGSGGIVRLWDAALGYGDPNDVPTAPPADLEKMAQLLADSYFDAHMMRQRVVEALRSDTTITGPLREAAIKLAESHEEDLNLINEQCWEVASWSGRTLPEYTNVLPLAEFIANHPTANADQLQTAGVALYRAGHYQKAIEVLERSHRARDVTATGDDPGNLALQSMTKAKLGNRHEALADFERARALAGTKQWAGNRACQDFLREANWQLSAEAVQWKVIDPADARSINGTTLTKLDDLSLLASGTNPEQESYVIAGKPQLQRIAALRIDTLPHETLPEARSGRQANGAFVLTACDIIPSTDDNVRKVAIRDVLADYCEVNFDPRSIAGISMGQGWAIWQGQSPATSASIVLLLKEPLELLPDQWLYVVLIQESKYPQSNLGRFRLSVTDGKVPNPSESHTK